MNLNFEELLEDRWSFKDEGGDRGGFSEGIEKWETLGGGREEKVGEKRQKK